MAYGFNIYTQMQKKSMTYIIMFYKVMHLVISDKYDCK